VLLELTKVQVLRALHELAALEEDCLNLWQRDPRSTPFQSPAWLLPWARYFTGGNILSVVWRNDQKLLALVPAFVWRNPESGKRELLLLGQGISDYLGPIIDPEEAHNLVVSIHEWLNQNQQEWDVVNFNDLRADSRLVGGDPVRVTPSPTLDHYSCAICPVLSLLPAPEIPAQQLHNINYYRRRAERLGVLEFETATESTLNSMLEDLFLLHSARWQERGLNGVLAEEKLRSFHREAACALLRNRMLRMYCMRCAGKAVAVLYGFSAHRRTYYYLSGFDPAFSSISPGTLIVGHAIDQAIKEDRVEFDFLRGVEKYKYLWGAKDSHTFRLKSE
jgi:CelD/BcsL family acetyltransferase involved in cellulose biosynthesis